MKWQTIESAPRDGTIVLLARADGAMSIDSWSKFMAFNQPQWSHWMPLPEPPEVTK